MGKLSPEQIGFAISQCNPHFITQEERDKYAQAWDKLKAENSKLRIVNGYGVRSVPIEYYFRIIESVCPKGKPFRLTRLLNLLYKYKKRHLNFFPYYFWATQFNIMLNRGILRKVKEINDVRWGFDCWVEYVER